MWCMIEMICVVIILSEKKIATKILHSLIDTVALQLKPDLCKKNGRSKLRDS